MYFPGLISLVCLPLFCLTKIIYPKYFEKLTAINVAWLNDKELNNGYFKPLKHKLSKKFEDDSLTADNKHNAIILAKLQEKINYYDLSDDTLSGYRLTFTDHSKYGDVVNVLDILQLNEKKLKGFVWINNKIEIVKIRPVHIVNPPGNLANDEVLICGMDYDHYNHLPFFSIENFNDLYQIAKEFIQRFWLSLIFLLLLVMSAIVSRTKYAANLR